MPLIAVGGSQGTGKTSLIAALPYKNITRKTSRSIQSDWGVSLSQVNNDRQLTIRFQDEILKRKLADEAHAVHSEEVFITERTFADLFVYALVAIGKDNEYSDWLNDYYHQCAAAQSQYFDVFYLAGGHFPPVNDGVRAVNEHYSWMVDMCMYEYTMRLSGPGVTVIDTPGMDERIKIVTNIISNTTKKV